jgi:hypothetical protein
VVRQLQLSEKRIGELAVREEDHALGALGTFDSGHRMEVPGLGASLGGARRRRHYLEDMGRVNDGADRPGTFKNP